MDFGVNQITKIVGNLKSEGISSKDVATLLTDIENKNPLLCKVIDPLKKGLYGGRIDKDYMPTTQ